MSLPKTLGELKAAGIRTRSVKDEIRQNLIKALRDGDELFTRKDDKGKVTSRIIGYEDTVIPQIVNALLAKHN
ncbi:MAG TPA: magnesium chelatase, partial [Blastocatellia bacterium]